ncbi:hypothetical protein HKD37_16G045364 [Glycine soja]
MENCWWEQELQSYNQHEEERIPNLEIVLMKIMETSEATQHAIQILEIQVGKLAKEVTKLPFLVTRKENFVEVEAHEESLVEEHDSREKKSILQVNTPPHQLIGKEERHGECDKSLSVILSLITGTSLAMIWKVFPGYKSFMESLAKRQKCKEKVFYVTFMPL